VRRQLALTAVVVAAAVIAGIGLFTILRTEPDAPAVASTEAPSRAAGTAPARPILDEAVRELDLVRPTRLKRAEDFTVALLRGEPLKLSEQRGKPVMINFWATWCAPCREEMPAIERLYRRHREHGFVLLAVSVDADAALVRPFLEQHKLTFPVALDSKMSLANAYSVRALPSSFLVDRNGNLAALALGPRAWDNRVAHALVEGMLAQ
jgi:cytochrome c biogenesis protein CcmG, thiol:disulfide interchange protein DsbE